MAEATIFAVLDPMAMEQASLEWAEQIALAYKTHRDTDAVLHVYCCINDTSVAVVPRAEEALAIEETEARVAAWVERLVQHTRGLGIAVETEIEWNPDWRQAIGPAATRCGATLVVKGMTQHGRLIRLVRETSDWQLLRVAACPVLLVKTGRPYRIDKMLVALKPSPNDEAYEAVNDRILQTAKAMSDALGAPLHAVTCYEHTETPDRQRFADRCGLQRNQVSGGTGAPEKVIAETAERLGTALLVIARVARPESNGILGSTAEKVIDEINNEILVLPMTA
jgi:universal stress protein E